MKKLSLFYITLTVFGTLFYHTISECAAAAKGSVKYKARVIKVKPTIETTETISALKALTVDHLTQDHLKDMKNCDENVIGTIEAQAQTTIENDNATKKRFVTQYVDIKNSREHAFENRDLKALAQEADNEWNNVKNEAIEKLNRRANALYYRQPYADDAQDSAAAATGNSAKSSCLCQ